MRGRTATGASRFLSWSIAALLADSFVVPASAHPDDLSAGAMIAHHVPELAYSSTPPAGGWCAAYAPHAIHYLARVIPTIQTAGTQPAMWYVLAAWEAEEKTWCEVSFGFGDYDADAFTFAVAQPCFPNLGFELPTAGWPGPNEGTAFAAAGEPWHGNWLPVYAFAGYAYGGDPARPATVIRLGPDPATGAIGWRNCCPQRPQFFTVAPEGRGAMGINTAGVVPEFPQLPEPGTCCLGGIAMMTYQSECDALGGIFHPGIY